MQAHLVFLLSLSLLGCGTVLARNEPLRLRAKTTQWVTVALSLALFFCGVAIPAAWPALSAAGTVLSKLVLSWTLAWHIAADLIGIAFGIPILFVIGSIDAVLTLQLLTWLMGPASGAGHLLARLDDSKSTRDVLRVGLPFMASLMSAQAVVLMIARETLPQPHFDLFAGALAAGYGLIYAVIAVKTAHETKHSAI